MKLLITGGTGFVGHHIVEYVLQHTDWDVIVMDRLSYAGNLHRLMSVHEWTKHSERVQFIFHDLRAEISESIHRRLGHVDYIWNLAAESHVENSLRDSIPFVQSNVLGTANLLEYVKKKQPGIRMFAQFSTDEVYGPANDGELWTEWDRLKPSNPYAASKAGADCLAFSFAHSFNLPVIITRTMNIFGERQHPEKFIPKTIRALLNREKVLIHGTPGNISSRHWVHAKSVGEAMMFLVKNGSLGEIYNVVGQEMDVLEIAHHISNVIFGHDIPDSLVEFVDYHQTRPGHDRRYALDGSKIRSMGFSASVDLKQALTDTVQWTLHNREWLS